MPQPRQESKYDLPASALSCEPFLRQLRPRERQYLTWRALGFSWGQIALKMGITRRTIWDYARSCHAIWEHVHAHEKKEDDHGIQG